MLYTPVALELVLRWPFFSSVGDEDKPEMAESTFVRSAKSAAMIANGLGMLGNQLRRWFLIETRTNIQHEGEMRLRIRYRKMDSFSVLVHECGVLVTPHSTMGSGPVTSPLRHFQALPFTLPHVC